MNRRGFLKSASRVPLAAAAAATMATWPAFLREAFADAAKSESGEEALAGLAVVSEGYRRAQRAGKPLLVLIIPEKPEAKYGRGALFGAFLNHGTVDQLYPLALCEVICATLADLRRLVPSVGTSEPLMVLVETDQVPATVRRLEVSLATKTELVGRADKDPMREWERLRKAEDGLVLSHNVQLGDLLRTALLDGTGVFEARKRQALATLPTELVNAVSQAAHPGSIELYDADRAAILILDAAERRLSRPQSYELKARLREAVRQRLVSVRVPGSHWAQSAGCGTHIEGIRTTSMIACGMGHVPEKSRRFLYFFTVPKNPRGFDP